MAIVNAVEEFRITGDHGEIVGLLKSPPGISRGTILCVHGNPDGDLKGNNGIFDQIAEVTVPLGYLVVQFSLYGSAPSSGSTADTTIRKQVDDFRSMIAFARKRSDRPLHIIGESAGATVAALAWDSTASSYMLLWPAFDLRDTDLRPYLSPEWEAAARENGFIRDGELVLGKDYLDELRCMDFEPLFDIPAVPTILMHGREDTEVPFAQSLKAVSRSCGPVTLIAVPDGRHGLKRPADRSLVLDNVRSWFNRA